MPCLICCVLSRRFSSAVISASMSDRTVAMAVCSEQSGGKVIDRVERHPYWIALGTCHASVLTI